MILCSRPNRTEEGVMKTAAIVIAAVIAGLAALGTIPAAAQLGGAGTSVTGTAGGPNPSGAGPTRRELPLAVRQFRDRPFGSMGTGSIMGATGTDAAMGTGGSIGTGTGHGTGIGMDTGPGMAMSNTGYRFSPVASPTNPRPLGVTAE
jgi:hypothetical protein